MLTSGKLLVGKLQLPGGKVPSGESGKTSWWGNFNFLVGKWENVLLGTLPGGEEKSVMDLGLSMVDYNY
ncbi:hypothetical protein EYF80_063797 [Liparis tanakae]|uniref:Uncharacterized protein n=1 Tax=Liparis tanakae TaxID=230148 RepID=A0A4Z2EB09_9TELE|nr:hypothetical protein EYF80_063797 [Liparis tanakae]